MATHDMYVKLRSEVAKAQLDYHTHDNPTLSDQEYDLKLRQLKDLEISHPEWVEGEAVSEVVGAPIKRGLYPVKHAKPMLSLDNVFSVDELLNEIAKWSGVEIVTSFKYDGLACSLTYMDHQLVEAATRGDRFEGESILHNVTGYPTIPRSLPKHAPGNITVRGELLMFDDEFSAYNERLAAANRPLAINPRNAAAGIARRLNNDKLPGAQLTFVPYGLIVDEEEHDPAQTYSEQMARLMRYGFQIGWIPQQLIRSDYNTAAVTAYVAAREVERTTLPFGIDGLVLRVNNLKMCDDMGFTSRAPRWAIAYKFPPEEKLTTLREIRLQIGRTGNATPVGILDPVVVGGVTVTNATLHNEDHIDKLGVAIGDKVLIRRAGDVVPEITKVVHQMADRVEWNFPSHCECGAPLIRPEGQANHQCTGGDACRFQQQRAFEHFVSRDAMDIDGLGPEIIEALIKAKKLEIFADLYKLTLDDLLAISSESSKVWAEKILLAIQASKLTTLPRFLYALGIPMAGHGTSRRLAEWFGRLDLIVGASSVLLQAVPDIGRVVAESIEQYFQHNASWHTLRAAGVELVDETGPSPDFAGYVDLRQLVLLARIPRVTPKSVDHVLLDLSEHGWPGPLMKVEGILAEHRPTFERIERDWELVKHHAHEARELVGGGPLDGSVYVVTGTFDGLFDSRDGVEDALTGLGAKMTGSVSKKTTALFVGDNPGASKVDKAKDLHIPLLYSNDLRELLAKHSK